MGDGRKDPGAAPACLEAAVVLAGWDTRSLGVTGSLLSFPCPLLHLVGGDSPPACWHLSVPNPHCVCGWNIPLAAGSSSSAPSRPGGFWGCHNDGWLLGSCQDLSRLGIPGCVGSAVSPGHQGPPGHHLRASDGNSQGGPLPYLTPCSAALLPCPGWLPGGTACCQASLPGGLS